MKSIRALHHRFVHLRRVSTLSRHIGSLLPDLCSVLDVGCGDGLTDRLICAKKPGVSIEGINIYVQPNCSIPVKPFNGASIPYGDKEWDVVLFVDVLHHTRNPEALMDEAARVARKSIIIKDHICSGTADNFLLRFMDWVGNAPHGVASAYNYWSSEQWRYAFRALKPPCIHWERKLGIYPAPVDWLFGRKLHFIAKLNLGE